MNPNQPDKKPAAVPITTVLGSVMKELDREGIEPGLSTGFHSMDAYLGGLHRKDLIVIGSLPGVGKTAMALDMAQHVAIDEERSVLIFSPVTTSEALTHRFLSAMGSVDPLRLRQGHLDQHELNRMECAAKKLVKSRLLYVPGMPLTPDTIRTEATCIVKRFGAIDLIIVDDLPLMVDQSDQPPGFYPPATCAAELKQIAWDFDVAVLATMNLEQVKDDRGDPRPRLADLPGDGVLESIADVVVLLHRELTYDPLVEASGLAECQVVKNHHGPCTHPRFSIRLVFSPGYGRFCDLP